MDRVRVQAVTQFTLEDDVNIPENKPDVTTLNLEKGELIIDEHVQAPADCIIKTAQ